jgi:hypothetical protein
MAHSQKSSKSMTLRGESGKTRLPAHGPECARALKVPENSRKTLTRHDGRHGSGFAY